MNDNNMKKLTRSREHRMICGVFRRGSDDHPSAVCHIRLHRNRAACLLYCSSDHSKCR